MGITQRRGDGRTSSPPAPEETSVRGSGRSWRSRPQPTSSRSQGGFPDPRHVSRPRSFRDPQEGLIAAGDASAMQYAPTPGLPGPCAFIAERLEQLEGRRPEEGEFLITSGAIESLELLSKTFLDPGETWSWWRAPPTWGPSWPSGVSKPTSSACPSITMDSTSKPSKRRLAAGRVPKLLDTIPDHQNPAGLSLSADRRRPWWSWPVGTAFYSWRTWPTVSSASPESV